MNTNLDPEDVLRKYRLREPSVGLKERIAATTREEWINRGISVEFTTAVWRLAVGLAASLLIAVTGNSVNNMITASFARGNQNVAITSESTVNIDLDVDINIPARMQSVAQACQPMDVLNFIKMREMVNQELKDINGLFDKAALPGQWMYNLKSVSTERGKV